MINSIKIKGFRLLKDVEVNFGKINIIDGVNLDVVDHPSNASGKSTLVQALRFGITGELDKLTLKQVVSRGMKTTSVIIDGDELGQPFTIYRNIPSELNFYRDGEAVKANTPTLKQLEVDKLYGNKKFIDQFRNVSPEKNADLLELGPVSIRKVLMGFVDTLFVNARQKLLDEKKHREDYSTSKKPYCFSLSTRRLSILKNNLSNLLELNKEGQSNVEQQREQVQTLKTDIGIKESQLRQLSSQMSTNDTNVGKYRTLVEDYKKQIEIIDTALLVLPIKVNYEELIAASDLKIIDLGTILKTLLSEYEDKTQDSISLKSAIQGLEYDIKGLDASIVEAENEINEVEQAVSGQKCNKCGALITEANKDGYILDQQNIIKACEKKKAILVSSLAQHNTELATVMALLVSIGVKIKALELQRDGFRAEIKGLNLKNSEQEKVCNDIIQKGNKKDSEIEKYKSLISTTNEAITTLIASNTELELQLKSIPDELLELKESLSNEESLLQDGLASVALILKKTKKAETYAMKLEESFKFSEYKYTKVDIMEYDEAIKTLDAFAAFYINEWLQNLAIIINSLLQVVNMRITFTTDKSFMTIEDGSEEFTYDELSSGQRAFISTVVKIGILIKENHESGVIFLDESLDFIAVPNFLKLLSIFKTTAHQYFLVKQGVGNDMQQEGVTIINLVRENGETKIIKS
jgi:hypothetical protein